MDVSICIPVFNEKGALRSTVLELTETMSRLRYSYEIIVVDDGSSDGSIEEVRDLPLRIFRHKKNFGGGVARVTAMRYARGSIILQTDADGSYPCDEVPTILEKMMKGADMVVGGRRRESATDWRILRTSMKWTLKHLAAALANHSIPDLNSGMRAYRRDLALRYEHLYPKGHSIMSTMTLAFLTDGCRVEYVPIDYRRRVGASSFRPIVDTYNYLVTIIRTIATFDPLRLILPISLLVLLGGAGFAFRDLWLFRGLGNLSPVLITAALICFVLAIVADQLARLSRQLAKLTSAHLVTDDDVDEIATGMRPPDAAPPIDDRR